MLTLRTALAMLCSIVIVSCGDDTPTNNNGGNNNNNTTFTSKASGTMAGNAWTATSVLPGRHTGGGFVIVSYAAHGDNNSQLSFGIANASVNTFTVADATGNQASFSYGGKDYGENETGTITIQALTDKGMRGTFNITAKTSTGESATATGTFEAAF